ncbi:BrnT family toxin [Sphingomonas zeae]
MEIEFDPSKDQANVDKHGLSLADAVEFDLTAAVVVSDDRYDYGEVRYRAFGRVEGEARCLVFAVRGSVVRIISYRRAHEKEMRRYGV